MCEKSRSLGNYYSWASRGEERPWGADKAVPSGTDTILLQAVPSGTVAILGTLHSNSARQALVSLSQMRKLRLRGLLTASKKGR